MPHNPNLRFSQKENLLNLRKKKCFGSPSIYFYQRKLPQNLTISISNFLKSSQKVSKIKRPTYFSNTFSNFQTTQLHFVSEHLRKYERIWTHMQRYEKILENKRRYEKIWESLWKESKRRFPQKNLNFSWFFKMNFFGLRNCS